MAEYDAPLWYRILRTLNGSSGRLTNRQAATRFRVPEHSVRARLSDLRSWGWRIQTNTRTRDNRTVYTVSD